jgi:predicted GIY-YIG superfamily endonuclease
MCSSVQTPANAFIYLSGLLEIAYAPTPVFGCAQLKRNTERCRNKVTQDNLELLKASFDDLFEILNDRCHTFHDQDGVFDTVLTQLIASCLCRSRHQSNAKDARAQWLKELYNDRERYELRCKLQARLSGRLEESISSTPSRSPSTEFELCSASRDVAYRVTKKVLQPLTETDQKPGFIYLISHPRAKDMFKVGYTKNNEKRLNDHQRCYKDCKLVKSELSSYVHRVEQLILAEFGEQQHRLKEKCPLCGANHKEWLKVDKETLLTSLKKWVDFANGHIRPYDKNGNFRSKKVAMPFPARDPARDYKPSTSTPTKQPRRSDVAPQKSPTFDESDDESNDELDISISEGISKLNLNSQVPGNSSDDSGVGSSFFGSVGWSAYLLVL